MRPEHFLDRCPIALGRRHDAARAEHRLAYEGGDRLGPFLANQLVELVGAELREFLLTHLRVLAAIVIGRFGMKDLGKRQIKMLVEDLKPGKRARDESRAVIAAPARDD